MMTGTGLRVLPLLAAAGMALSLAGCAATTYGTGKSEGLQTMTDLAKIASFGEDKDPIDFSPRPPIIAPPDTATLPPPGSGSNGPALGANWPSDPNTQAALANAQIAAAQASGRPITVKSSGEDQPTIDVNDPKNYKTTAEQQAAVRKLLAQQNAGPVDGNGNPVRQFLTDPPSGYLASDPTAPAPTKPVASAGGGGIKWPWQWFKK
jgi:hypothetical protein